MSLFEELKRRNVFRVGIAYLLLGWAVLQGADFMLDLVGAPDWVIRALAVIGLVGFPFALFFAWAFELTPEGVKREIEVDRSQSVTPQYRQEAQRRHHRPVAGDYRVDGGGAAVFPVPEVGRPSR